MPSVSRAAPFPPTLLALLVRRVRVGLWISLTSITLFALADPFLNSHVLGRLYVIKAAQVAAAAAAVFRALRGAPTRLRVVLATLFAVTVFSVGTAISGIITNDTSTTPVLLVVLGMGTATLLPWGVRPQLAVQVIVTASILANLWALPGGGPTASLALAVVMGSCASVYAAYAPPRYQP